jgi:hypothetical protein
MENVTGTDLIGQAIADLYSGDPDAFVARRRELAAEARAAGDREAAKAIAGLGKPTRSAWAVNRLVHSDPEVPAGLAELGDKLRAGEAALDGASIRELSRARRELIEALTRRALTGAGQGQASAAMREEVSDTFSAALADPGVAEQVAAGRLVRAAHWAGFGPGIGTAAGATPARAPSATGAKKAVPPKSARKETAEREAAESEAAEREGTGPGELVERERQRRAAMAEAEQAVAKASSQAEAAEAAEREVADSVLFMQERLNREQQRLAQAKRDTRQATAALNRAKQALQRIRRQSW